MNLVYRENYTVTAAQVDDTGCLRSSDILRLSQEVSAQHCKLLGADNRVLDEKGLFWAIIRNQITVYTLPTPGQVLTLETWPMPSTRTCFPRGVVAYDGEGRMLFACHSLWILMDKISRGLVLPGKSGIEVPGILRPEVPPAPKSLSPLTGGTALERTVEQADLDRNGHMNNARYLDWVCDALGPEFRRENRLKSATLCYLNEAKEGQKLTLLREKTGENGLVFDIRRGADAERVFSAKLEFDSVVL